MDDYEDFLHPDIIECVIESFKEDEENDKHLVLAAKRLARLHGCGREVCKQARLH